MFFVAHVIFVSDLKSNPGLGPGGPPASATHDLQYTVYNIYIIVLHCIYSKK